MKKLLILFTACLLLITFPGCEVLDISTCEYVVNSNGPSFLKVKNNLKQEVFVDLRNVYALGAELKSGKCEIYGLPSGTYSNIIIENQKTNKSKTLHFTVATGETYTVTVDDDFFNN
jgi:hypothetical protein